MNKKSNQISRTGALVSLGVFVFSVFGIFAFLPGLNRLGYSWPNVGPVDPALFVSSGNDFSQPNASIFPASYGFNLEVENYNNGGANVGYFDKSNGNSGGTYRNDDVDIKDLGNGNYAVSSLDRGEWLKYDINLNTSGEYQVGVSYSAIQYSPTAQITLKLDGTAIAQLEGTRTGSYNTYQLSETQTVNIPSGSHTLEIFVDERWMQIDKLVFTGDEVEANQTASSSSISSTSASSDTPGTDSSSSGTSITATLSSNSSVSSASSAQNNSSSSSSSQVSTPSTPVAGSCAADYDRNGTVDFADLIVFSQNYQKDDISCQLDIAGDDCYLDLQDLTSFASVYRKPGYCAVATGS